jgi:hypothetical protein
LSVQRRASEESTSQRSARPTAETPPALRILEPSKFQVFQTDAPYKGVPLLLHGLNRRSEEVVRAMAEAVGVELVVFPHVDPSKASDAARTILQQYRCAPLRWSLPRERHPVAGTRPQCPALRGATRSAAQRHLTTYDNVARPCALANVSGIKVHWLRCLQTRSACGSRACREDARWLLQELPRARHVGLQRSPG